jgi:hypothetical protein
MACFGSLSVHGLAASHSNGRFASQRYHSYRLLLIVYDIVIDFNTFTLPLGLSGLRQSDFAFTKWHHVSSE